MGSAVHDHEELLTTNVYCGQFSVVRKPEGPCEAVIPSAVKLHGLSHMSDAV